MPRLVRSMRAAPATLPCGAAVALFGVWALRGAAFPVATWAPGAVVVVGLLAVAVAAVPLRDTGVPRVVLAAATLLAAYAAWSFASIAWADDPGYALQGAARTLLYALVFALFALWPQRLASAGLLLGGWMAFVALVGLVLAWRGLGDAPAKLLIDARLKAPTGYPNATAVLLLMPVPPAVILAASGGVRPAWRGLAATTAVGLAGLALLTGSRGAVYTMPGVLLVLLAVVPGRVRHVLALLPIGVVLGVCAPRLLRVGDAAGAGQDPGPALHRALVALAVASLVAGLVAGLAATLARRRRPGADTQRRLDLGARAAVVGLVVGGLLAGLVVTGDPVDRAHQAWRSFEGGYTQNDQARNRLVGGLGSNRYDFYRVSFKAFRDHPVGGIGADNFYQKYLRAGRSPETPRYPHSWELRALAQTGLVGGALLLGFLVCAGVAVWRAMRAGGTEQAAVAGAATMAAVVWLAHGSLDWFWEWAGLGAPVFAMLGLACALAPRRAEGRRRATPGDDGEASRGRDGVDGAAGGVAAERREDADVASVRLGTAPSARARLGRALASLVLGALLAAPFAVLWWGDHQQQAAARVSAARPFAAYRMLHSAASVDPFSSAPATLEGSIALRFADLPRADAAFGRALTRVPRDQYATLEQGAVASARGDRLRALHLIARAVSLAPRDALAREALGVLEAGGALDVQELNRRLYAGTTQFGR